MNHQPIYTLKQREYESFNENCASLQTDEWNALLNYVGNSKSNVRNKEKMHPSFIHQSLESAKFQGNREEEARLLMVLGNLALQRGFFECARSYFESTLALMKNLNDMPNKIKVTNALAESLTFMGKSKQALSKYKLSRKLSQELGNKAQEVAIESKIACIEMCKGKIENAILVFKNSLKFYESQKNAELLSEILINLGKAYSLQGNWKLAKQYFTNAYNIHFQELKPVSGTIKAQVLYYLGITAWKLGKWDDASQFYEQSISLLRRQNDDVMLIHLLLASAELKTNKEQLLIAYDYCLQGLKLATKFGYQRMKAKAYCIIAEIEMRSGNLKQATKNYHKGIRLFKEIENNIELVFAMNDLSVPLILSGKLSEAELILEKCVALFQEQKTIEGIAQTNLHYGFLEQEKRNNTKADFFFSKALNIFLENGNVQGQAKSLLGKGCLKIQQRDLNTALQFLEKALKLFEQLDGIKPDSTPSNFHIMKPKIHTN